MAKVPMIALTTIQRCTKPGKAATKDSPAVPPETEWIASGKPFDAVDQDEADELERVKGARKVKGGSAQAKEATSKKPEANQSSKQTPAALEGDARVAEIKRIMSTLTDDGKTAAGVPNVPSINEKLPTGTKGISAKERDALWAEVSGEGSGSGSELV